MKMPASSASEASKHHSVSTLLDWTLLVLPGLIWGASFLFIAEGLESLPPNGVTFTRLLIGFLTLSVFPGVRKPVARSDWGGVALLGVIWMALPLSMFPFAEQSVSSALTGMLNGATPLLVAAVASLLARRLPGRGVLIGLAVGFAGTILVAAPTLGSGSSQATGVLLILIALVCYGFSVNLARPLQQRNGALPVIWRALGFATLLTAPLGAPALHNAHWTPASLFSMVALGAFGTAIAYVLLAVAAGRIGATRASATTFLIPAVALILGVVVRGERVALLSLCGGAVSFGGAILIRRASLLPAKH
ncbi:DMT family transporter [uncultured Paludibaculum sp.]|uniref:DMT family transporter n=1 Tax=uncultured Paludibaculum sp. TaxID=1765020 RepID=UPI002AAB378F|nr:DMT family transporter [uncultured Paludibaculum sp.]